MGLLMRKRLLLSIAAMIAIVCVVLLILAMLPPSGPGTIKANFDRIKKGMTGAQVKSILGAPSFVSHREDPSEIWDWHDEAVQRWHGDEAVARVVLVDDAAVQLLWFDSTESAGQKMRRWLRLP
jgi:hypothetical protein